MRTHRLCFFREQIPVFCHQIRILLFESLIRAIPKRLVRVRTFILRKLVTGGTRIDRGVARGSSWGMATEAGRGGDWRGIRRNNWLFSPPFSGKNSGTSSMQDSAAFSCGRPIFPNWVPITMSLEFHDGLAAEGVVSRTLLEPVVRLKRRFCLDANLISVADV